MKLKPFVLLLLPFGIPLLAQDIPKSVAITQNSNIPATEIAKLFQKHCRNTAITSDTAKSNFTLEAIKQKEAMWNYRFDLTLFDRDGLIVRSVSEGSLEAAVKPLCQRLKTQIIVLEVVDPENLTQSADVRGNKTTDVYGNPGGAITPVINAVTGRRTHTDASTMAVVVNGEHALLDCYERRKGCVPIGPGKYYGEFDPDKRSIWVDHDIPLTHQHVRDHYVRWCPNLVMSDCYGWCGRSLLS